MFIFVERMCAIDMPLFDYKCECGKEEEVLVEKKSDEVFCRDCGKKMTRKETNAITSIFTDRTFVKGKKQLLN